jgi:hypothetical protein
MATPTVDRAGRCDCRHPYHVSRLPGLGPIGQCGAPT